MIMSFYHYPYTCKSAYVLWKRLISKRKTGITRIRIWRKKTGRTIERIDVLWTSCRIGDLSIIMFMMKQGCDIIANDNWAIQLASSNGHLQIIKWLYTMGCDPTTDSNLTILLASKYGHLRIVKWLHKICDDVDHFAFQLATHNGQLRIAEWLSKRLDPNNIIQSHTLLAPIC